VRLSTIVVFAIATAFTFAAHEGAHWAMGEWLGYDMFLRANSAGLARGLYRSEADAQLVTAAGPAVTLLQGLVAYLFIRAGSAGTAFAFLLSALLMRVLAAGVSLATPNDEMRLSLWLELGKWAVFAGVIGVLFALTAAGAWHLRLSERTIAAGVACWIVFASAVILSERFLPTYSPYAAP
jgi:hypothetical protein